MSEMIDIIAPSLEQVNYGENIQQQFQNIDDNFKSIVNNEYLKGDRGANIYIEKLSLLESGVLQDKFKSLFNSDISDLGIGSINSTTLYMLYARDENNNVTAVSSLPYTFLDPRFNPPPTDPVEIATLNETEDKSCIVMYDESLREFTTINSFPTIYYNQSGVTTTGEADGVGSFCWRINDVKTDLPAQGPKGDRGADGFVYFMMAGEKIGENEIYKVELYQGLYPNVTGKFDYSALDGHMGIVWHNNDWYMSPLCYDDVYGLIYSKNKDANIRNILATQSFCEIMLQSHPNNTLNSLFLPKDYPGESIRDKTPSHIITTAKFEDEDYFGKNDNPKILVLAPGEVRRSGSRTLKAPDEEHKFIIGYNNVKIGDKIETKLDSDGQYKTDIKTQLEVEGPTHITGYTLIDGDTRINGDTIIDADTRLQGNARITGNTLIEGSVTLGGFTIINQNLNVAGNTTIDRDTGIRGSLRVDENAIVRQNLTVFKDLVTDNICFLSDNTLENTPFITCSCGELIKAKFPSEYFKNSDNVSTLIEQWMAGMTIALQITICNKYNNFPDGMSYTATFKRTTGSAGSEIEFWNGIISLFNYAFDELIEAGTNLYGRDEFKWEKGDIISTSKTKYIEFWYKGNQYDTELIVELKGQSCSQKATFYASEHNEGVVLQLIGGVTAIKGNTRMEGDTLIQGNVWIGDDASINGNATIDGKLTVKDLKVGGTMDLSNSFETVSTKTLQVIPSTSLDIANVYDTPHTLHIEAKHQLSPKSNNIERKEIKTVSFNWDESSVPNVNGMPITTSKYYDFDGEVRVNGLALHNTIEQLTKRIEQLESQLNK